MGVIVAKVALAAHSIAMAAMVLLFKSTASVTLTV
ncbi:hypothetical protein N826_25855 [Skermanella aerolata KACC 11604]|nr:hypothetical protein N826_25855 [Skermanella aerolata KACC 11604]